MWRVGPWAISVRKLVAMWLQTWASWPLTEMTARGGMRTTQPGAGMSYPGKGGSVRKGLGASSLMTSNFDLRGVYDCKSKTPVMVSVAAGRAVPLRKHSAYKVDDDYFDEDASDCDEQQPAFEGREDSCDNNEDHSNVRSPPRHFVHISNTLFPAGEAYVMAQMTRNRCSNVPNCFPNRIDAHIKLQTNKLISCPICTLSKEGTKFVFSCLALSYIMMPPEHSRMR